MDEIKEAISTTSTPVKVLANDRLQSDLMETENESTDGSDVGDRQRKISGELGSYKGSHSNLKELEELPESLYIVTPEAESNFALLFKLLLLHNLVFFYS